MSMKLQQTALIFAACAAVTTSAISATAADVEAARDKVARATPAQMSQAWDLFEAGVAAARSGKRSVARSTFLAGLEIYPGDTQIRFLVATLLEAEGNQPQALEQWLLAEALATQGADKARARAAATRLAAANSALSAAALPEPKPKPLTAEEVRRLYERSASDPEAVAKLRLAADEGQVVAQVVVGQLYEDGVGLPKDRDQAARWYRKGVDAGSATAKEKLAALTALRDTEMRREREAVEAARRQAEADRQRQAVERQQQELARLIGLYNQAKAGDASKFADLQELARGGHAEAQNFVGVCYLNGFGTNKDDVEATRWWVRSARQGNPSAKKNLDMLRNAGYMVDVIERSTK